MNYIVTRPHCSTTWMQPVVTVGVALSVGQSVCLSVTIMSPAKMAEPIEMLFGLWTRVGPMNYVLDGVSDVNKDLGLKAKDLDPKAKDLGPKAKDLSAKVKAKVD